jgi:hypothetical protein
MKMDKIAEKMAELADKYGPNVVDAARGVAQVEGVSTIVAGCIALGIAALLSGIGVCMWRSQTDRYGDYDGQNIILVIIGFFAIFAFLLGLWQVIDPWTWTAINHPDLWIAKKVLHL